MNSYCSDQVPPPGEQAKYRDAGRSLPGAVKKPEPPRPERAKAPARPPQGISTGVPKVSTGGGFV